MEIEGQVSVIIYCNEINSYTIAKLKTEEGEITIVGYLPFISMGDQIIVVGEYVTHKDYGKQFKVNTFRKNLPETPEALEKYLASRKSKMGWTQNSQKNYKSIWRQHNLSYRK